MRVRRLFSVDLVHCKPHRSVLKDSRNIEEDMTSAGQLMAWRSSGAPPVFEIGGSVDDTVRPSFQLARQPGIFFRILSSAKLDGGPMLSCSVIFHIILSGFRITLQGRGMGGEESALLPTQLL